MNQPKASCLQFNCIFNSIQSSLFVNVNVLLNNSVTTDVYGVANGIAVTAASFGRAVSPSVFGNLYTWSLRNVQEGLVNPVGALGFPFNQYFSFIVTGLAFCACAVIATFGLPPRSPQPTISSSDQDV